jgi:hypothetical protein
MRMHAGEYPAVLECFERSLKGCRACSISTEQVWSSYDDKARRARRAEQGFGSPDRRHEASEVNSRLRIRRKRLDIAACPGNPNQSTFVLCFQEPGLLDVHVFYHDKCFDGACSASLFTRFHRECIAPDAAYSYHGLVHRAGALFNEADFTGDENAIVDFKYSSSPKITWWFDHHLSAFLTPQDHHDFLRGVEDGHYAMRRFYDAHYTSCTSFLAHIATTKFGFDAKPVAELVKWADIVDGALYESAESAVEMAAPAMKLTLVIESAQDNELIPRMIPLLTEESLYEVLREPFVAKLLPPLMERHQHAIELIRERSECIDGTIYFDISDQQLEGYNKFIPYYLHPEAVYSIGLSKSSFRTKVAVGSNPWTKVRGEDMLNLATICERYGGGGHARVGAISFPPDRSDEARKTAAKVVAELRAHHLAVSA